MTKNYETLQQDVDNARAELDVAEKKITAHQDTLDLFSDKPVEILNCKNVFKNVKAGATVEEGPISVDCGCFHENEDCCNRKCSHFSDNLVYMDARSKLFRMENALKEFKKSCGVETVR